MQLIHLSEDYDLTHLTPTIPRYAIDTIEDMTIPRVCFSNSIEGALKSIDGFAGRRLFVYTPTHYVDIMIPTRKQVSDAIYTGEVWSLATVEVKLIGMIVIDDHMGYDRIEDKVLDRTISIPNIRYVDIPYDEMPDFVKKHFKG